MSSQGRAPLLEELLSTGKEPSTTRSTTTTNYDQNPNEIHNPTGTEFSYPFSMMNFETTYTNGRSDQTFAPRDSTLAENQVIPYFVGVAGKDNLAHASAIWTQSSIGQNGLHYYKPLYVEPVDSVFHTPIPSLRTETNIPDVCAFLIHAQEPNTSCAIAPPSVMTDVHNPASTDTTNLEIENIATWENASDTTGFPFYNPTSSGLQHLSLPFSQIPFQQNGIPSEFSYELTNQLSHYGAAYSNQTNNTISTACFDQNSTLVAAAADYYSEPQIHAFAGDIPNQTLPSFYQLNHVPQSLLDQYLLETQTNSQLFNETPQQTTNYINECNSSNLCQLSDICADTNQCRLPTLLRGDTVPRNARQEVSENSMYTRISVGAKSLAHQPLCSGNVDEPDPFRKSSCIQKSNIKTFVPKFYEKLKFETDLAKTEQRPLCLVKEASLSQQVRAQVDEFVNSPNKRQKTNPGKWSCLKCGKKLARASSLEIHMRQHSGNRPFKCPSCPKTFAQSSLLQSHSRRHTGERPFSCPTCQKAFSHSSALRTHMRTHTGERPHKCPVPNCGMAFTDSSTLSKHARVHSGERPFSCSICGRQFTQSGNMNKHKRAMHKVTNKVSMEKIPVSENTMILSKILENNENTTCATTDI